MTTTTRKESMALDTNPPDNNPEYAYARESWWAPEKGQPKQRGIRVQRGRHFLWLPMSEALSLANDIADQIEANR